MFCALRDSMRSAGQRDLRIQLSTHIAWREVAPQLACSGGSDAEINT